jgi:hypothetical protein
MKFEFVRFLQMRRLGDVLGAGEVGVPSACDGPPKMPGCFA